MIWIIFLIALSVGILGVVIYEKAPCDYETVGIVMGMIGFVIAFVGFIFALAFTCMCVDTAKTEEKIEMYETENAKIEQQMMVIVQKYQEYEQEIFGEVTEKNVMFYITLYPELRSDSLVEKQMSIYYSNHEKIAKLKENQIMASLYRWWVYFGW
jgi:hypothetical protein